MDAGDPAGLIVAAPMAGWAAPLDEVPDPVFADRMMGDGVAIHPTGATVHAPCDGTVAALHAAGHAVTIRAVGGAEILVHIGLDTVALGGRGFTVLVAEGAAVARGDALIAFDLDAVACGATSLVTPVVVANSDAFRIRHRIIGQPVAVGDPLLTLVPVATASPDDVGGTGDTVRRTVTVPLAHGIHARPAARIVACARDFAADIALARRDRRAGARSAVSVMALGLRQGDAVTIEARGGDATAAADAIAALIASGMDEATDAPPPPAAPSAPPPPPPAPDGALAGVTAAPGLAIGTAAWLTVTRPEIARDAADPEIEATAFDAALAQAAASLEAAGAHGDAPQRQILAAHRAFLDDAELLAESRAHIAAGRSAGFAWSAAIAVQSAALRASGDARIAERADDLADLERRVLAALAGDAARPERYPPGTVLLADELLPSQLIALDRGTVAGVVLMRGGATAHVAILAASLGLPMLVAVGTPLRTVAAGATLVLDADAGLLHVDPGADALAAHRSRADADAARRSAALAAAHHACRTADGTRIELFANLGSLDDAAAAVARGAEGSGLLRTEFLFMDRADAPAVDEQTRTYQAIAAAMAGRPVIIRLLDIGGDKPVSWLPIAAEANPMLGRRGIRATLAQPHLLQAQVAAILRVRPAGQCRIMVPMVAALDELRAVRAIVDAVAASEGIADAVALGVMIETPAAAITADLIAAEADFLSIGTNDLTQYTLAMDRENAAVAPQVDALHPAVLRLIARTCEGGAQHRRPVGVCGGLASDPLGIPLLIGLGATELSTTPAFVPEAKALVRRLDLAACRALAAEAVTLAAPAEVRARVRAFLEDLC